MIAFFSRFSQLPLKRLVALLDHVQVGRPFGDALLEGFHLLFKCGDARVLDLAFVPQPGKLIKVIAVSGFRFALRVRFAFG